MDAYKARCGNRLCELQILDSTKTAIRDYCPECSCEITCIISRNCCPDLFFRFSQSCIETSFMNFNNFHNDKRAVSMISHCPMSSNNVTKRKCEISTSLQQKLQNIPVYSFKSGLSYRNVHCSVCHNESMGDIIQWKIEIECAKFADFNFLSSYSEIIDFAMEKKCDFFYSSSGIDGLRYNTCDDNYLLDDGLISKCNVSGTWIAFDASIDFACRMYDNRFNSFKNVFCHLCNPPIDIRDVISKCNTTGLWDVYSADLEKACLNNIQSPLTTPFKNIYCFLCNSNNKNKTDNVHFKELEFSVEERIEYKREFVLQFKTIDFNLESIFESGAKYLKDTNPEIIATKQIDVIETKDLHNLNRTHIMVQYFAFTGSPLFCQNYSMFPMTPYCDCSDSCYFKNGCCIDKLFQKSTSCTDLRYSYNKNGYVVFDTCTKSTNALTEKLCRINDIEKFFTFQPVEIQMADDYTHYKNVYCALCSDGIGQSTFKNTNSASLKLWDLTIRCNVYLPPFFFLSFEEYFRFVRDNRCDIKYKPSEYTNYVKCEEKEYKQCNTTGHWMHRDMDIQFACENITMPMNLDISKQSAFCSICNPEHNQTVEYSKCNVTGFWNNYVKETTEKYCLSLPRIDYLAPYKNKFCKICNGVYDDEGLWALGSSRSDSIFPKMDDAFKPPSYRVIFEFSYNKQSSKQNTETPRCNSSQIVYLNECRDVRCYPGRMHVDTGCTPLFQTTTNLGYILYARLKTSLLINVNDTMPFFELVDESFKENIRKCLRLSYIDFETSISLSNFYCPRNQLNKLYKGHEILILVYHKLFITDSVNRSRTEEQLVALLGSTFNVTHDDFEQPFLIEHDANAFHLPSLVSRMQFTDKCYSINETSRSYTGRLYVHSHVNQLLVCEQIELNENEFSVNLKNLQLTVFSRNTNIEQDDYFLTSPRKARICVNRLQTLITRKDSFNSADVWNIVALVLTCISLGVFIFISYVCNRRVLSLYKQTRMSLSENSSSRTSRHTTSTELSGI
ncbi:unnamed protein product [Mytilus coruscus]|uniref:SMB domain-containing protein n=1 Tax=Mytilus coruscus TaxID=42192 RepID=A0A6J8ECR0_MYTCO|nr:unnamed protein product [Mytilus coruscus]